MTERIITIHFKFEERVLQLNTSQNLEGALDVQDEELAINHSNGVIRLRTSDILYIAEYEPKEDRGKFGLTLSESDIEAIRQVMYQSDYNLDEINNNPRS